MPLTTRDRECAECGTPIWTDNKSGYAPGCVKKAGLPAPMTSEQRSNFKLCGAKSAHGGICRLFAGQGTDHPGWGKCSKHGGKATSVRALKEHAQAEMIRLGAPQNVTPNQALLGLLRMSAGMVAWLHQEIVQLTDLDSNTARALIALHGEERDRLLRISLSPSTAASPRS